MFQQTWVVRDGSGTPILKYDFDTEAERAANFLNKYGVKWLGPYRVEPSFGGQVAA